MIADKICRDRIDQFSTYLLNQNRKSLSILYTVAFYFSLIPIHVSLYIIITLDMREREREREKEREREIDGQSDRQRQGHETRTKNLGMDDLVISTCKPNPMHRGLRMMFRAGQYCTNNSSSMNAAVLYKCTHAI